MPPGAFYAVQTLRQLLPPGALSPGGPVRAVEIPEVRIVDRPCMGLSGDSMLDVARHFFTVDEVKRTIDLMALHKMNVFLWHLTDDQGWRIEIRRYPELTRVGSVRTPDADRQGSRRRNTTSRAATTRPPMAAIIHRSRSARWWTMPPGASLR